MFDDLSVSRMSLSSPSASSTLEAEASAQTFCSSRDISPSPIPVSPAPLLHPALDPHTLGDNIEIFENQVKIEHRQRPAPCQGDKQLPQSPFCISSHPPPLTHTSRVAQPLAGHSPGCGISSSPSPTAPSCSPPHFASAFRSSRASAPSGASSRPEPLSVYLTARIALVGFLHEVSGDFNLQQETLFDSVSLMDRYLAATAPFTPPIELLQLVALACVFIASKCEETHPSQPTAADWIATTDYAFTIKSLVGMEWLVMDTFDYDLRCPTAYSYLHLLCHALSTCSAATICWATYLVELSLFDAQTQAHGHLQTAVAALLLAHLQSHSSASTISDAINTLVQVDREVVRRCASRLVQLHSSAAAVPASSASSAFCEAAWGQTGSCGVGGAVSLEQANAVSPVREKFGGAEWMCVSRYPLSLPG